ncbi:hypothetical protein SIM67_17570 [Haloferax mediterranei ATCC 33500]|nr:hypothetical protein [Haloferax mediterranei]MDX5990038.1 hypothetical protein [Haloferax mediterranei ATCC 33500]
MLGATGVGLGFTSGSAVAKGTPPEKNDTTIAQGTSGYTTSNKGTPDWFTIKDDGKWNVHDVKRTSDQGIITLGHGDCPGDSIEVSVDRAIPALSKTLNLGIHHCAGDLCDWGVEATLMGMTEDFGTTDDCNARLKTTHDFQVLKIDGYVEAHASWNNPLGMVDHWTIEIDAKWYDTSDGWQEHSIEARVDNPAV